MVTEDFDLPATGDWLVIPMTGTQVIVYNAGQTPVKVRLGAGSTSNGMVLETKDTIVAAETVYVKAVRLDKANFRIVVTR